MHDFYTRFYAAVATSEAHADFCRQVFGRNLCQHGFADLAQLDALVRVAGLRAGETVLDLGCGNGMIAEYISDRTGAAVTGLDYIPGAIEQARARTAAKAGRLSFVLGDINAPQLPSARFDLIIAIDSIYFSQDYIATVGQLLLALLPGGRLAFLYSYGREPWVPKEEFRADLLSPDRTPLAQALLANDLVFESWDFTADDHRLAKERLAVLPALQPRFATEDLVFLYDNRLAESAGVRQAIEEGLHRRYLYLARPVTAQP